MNNKTKKESLRPSTKIEPALGRSDKSAQAISDAFDSNKGKQKLY